ncbi:cytochrome P450 [Blakeslea trispora]|nr:cytochrome P450 [Blakeslea trispora]
MDYLKSVQLPNRLQQEHMIPALGMTAALLYISYRFIRQDEPSGLKEIPIPGSSYPYVGHMLSLGEFPGKQLAKWHEELGPIVKLNMGKQVWIAVNDPILAQKIFVANGVHTSCRPHITYVTDYYSKGNKGLVFSQPGPDFKKNRAIVNPLKMLELNSMNVVFNALFGRRFDSAEDPEFVNIANMGTTSMKFAGLEEDLPRFLPFMSIFDFMSNKTKRWGDFVDNKLQPTFERLIRQVEMSDIPCVVKSLEEFDMNMTEKIVFSSRYKETDFIIAGTDTVSTTLSWMFVLLCYYSDAQMAAIQEIDEFIKTKGRLPSFKERHELPLCVSIMKECMRFRPTTFFGLPHSSSKDIIVDGYLIPKDSTIVTSMESMHFKPDIFEDPNTFNPKRFMNNLKTMQSAANGRLEDRDHFNFGWGRRICPGIYLAESEIFLAFVELLSRAYIKPGNDALPNIDDAVNNGLTIMPASYKCKFVRRHNFIAV